MGSHGESQGGAFCLFAYSGAIVRKEFPEHRKNNNCTKDFRWTDLPLLVNELRKLLLALLKNL